jgi:SOS-response transcriptional repressor LexA
MQVRKRKAPMTVKGPLVSVRQRAILQFMYDYLQQHGHAPAIRDIGRGVGIASSSNVIYHVNRLVVKGYLSKGQGTSRTMVLLEAGYRLLGQPVVQELQAELAALQRENRRLRAWCHRFKMMAIDPAIQHELAAIQSEFAATELNGLSEPVAEPRPA